MDWTTIVIAVGGVLLSLIAAVIGGLVSSWRAARDLGKWQEHVEGPLLAHDARLARIDERLREGSERFEKMSVVEAVQEAVRMEFKEFKSMCSDRRSEMCGRLGGLERDQAAMQAACATTHKRNPK